MALGTVTRKELREDLRARLRDVAPEKVFLDSELNRWLEVAQGKVARVLRQVRPELYRDTDSGSDTTENTYFTVASSVAAKIESLSLSIDAGTTWQNVPLIDSSDFAAKYSNSLYTEYFGVVTGSETVKFNKALANPTSYFVMFLRKPVEMSTDGTALDVPDEYQELVIQYAMRICPKIPRDPNLDASVEGQLNSLFREEMETVQIRAGKDKSGEVA